ncbi:hypothetical protein [Pelagovum sp. HNIBRBA483]|uniref:hypothetical protein n=1 Tax=Pelagovum sp. HNIBRBA483 TaxID=3233341 RepID=UPI0034A5340D
MWDDLYAVKQRFEDDWQVYFLADGYEDHIATGSIRLVDVVLGFNIRHHLDRVSDVRLATI